MVFMGNSCGFRTSINELDFSVEITVVATSDNAIKITDNKRRYKYEFCDDK